MPWNQWHRWNQVLYHIAAVCHHTAVHRWSKRKWRKMFIWDIPCQMIINIRKISIWWLCRVWYWQTHRLSIGSSKFWNTFFCKHIVLSNFRMNVIKNQSLSLKTVESRTSTSSHWSVFAITRDSSLLRVFSILFHKQQHKGTLAKYHHHH